MKVGRLKDIIEKTATKEDEVKVRMVIDGIIITQDVLMIGITEGAIILDTIENDTIVEMRELPVAEDRETYDRVDSAPTNVGQIANLSVRKAIEVLPKICDAGLLKDALTEAELTDRASLGRLIKKRISELLIHESMSNTQVGKSRAWLESIEKELPPVPEELKLEVDDAVEEVNEILLDDLGDFLDEEEDVEEKSKPDPAYNKLFAKTKKLEAEGFPPGE